MRLTEQQFLAMVGAPNKKHSPSQKSDINCRTKRKSKTSKGEDALALQFRASGVSFEREFRFCPSRRWRADFQVGPMLIEIEGGIWSGGRHTRGKGYQADLEKYNWACSHGWTLLRYTTEQAANGTALAEILAVLAKDGEN